MRNLIGEAPLELLERRDPRRQARFLHQHYRNPIANRIRQPAGLGDEEVALLAQSAARQGTAQDGEQLGVDRVRR
jgi:hypothetical protein